MTLGDAHIQDRYPARVDPDGGREWIARAEPTVTPRAPKGPAHADELAAHARDGFHVQHDLLSEQELTACWGEIRALIEDADVRADERTITEPT